MEQKNRHLGRKLIFGVLTAAFVIALVAAPFVLEKRNKDKDEASILSAIVQSDSISKTLSGTGMLTEEEAVKVTIPEGVKITKYLVANGEAVKEGQPVAEVDKTSVMRTISDVNETLTELSSKIDEASGNLADQYISARSAGRVKAVYASSGDSVREVITQYGSLAVISLDGKMAVDLNADGLSAGQRVSVILSDEKEVSGLISSISLGTAVITIDDQYGTIGEEVTILDADGKLLGTGALYVHAPWNVIAYTGTIAGIFLREEQKVWNGTNLFRLSGTEDTAEYDMLTAQRREYEDIAYELFLLYQDGVVKAPCDGVVFGADESLLKPLSSTGNGYGIVLLAAHTPNGQDETAYGNRVGVITAVNEDGTATANIQLFDTQIDDYANLSGVSLDTSLMTAEVTITPGVIYYYNGVDEETGEVVWTQAWGTVNRGDLYVFAYDAGLAWMIYAGHVDLPEPEPEPSPQVSPTPDTPTIPGGGGGGMPSGGFGGGMGTVTQQEEEIPEASAGTTILSVTPQDTVSITITVDELDILSVRMGQDVSVTVDALPGQSFRGDITSIDTTATNEGGNTKYAVEITMDRTEKMLGGMNASAKITLQTKENILTIPTEALTQTETGCVVYTDYDESTQTLLSPMEIVTGLSDGIRTEVLSGLTEGEKVWYTYYDKLEDSGTPEGFPG